MSFCLENTSKNQVTKIIIHFIKSIPTSVIKCPDPADKIYNFLIATVD